MAKCDEGYLCSVCGEEVEGIQQSDLYLRFVIGEMDPEQLHVSPERHISCNPVLAQFIDDDRFRLSEESLSKIPDGFGRGALDAQYSAQRCELVTRGWRRLAELAKGADLAIHEYPLPECQARWRQT